MVSLKANHKLEQSRDAFVCGVSANPRTEIQHLSTIELDKEGQETTWFFNADCSSGIETHRVRISRIASPAIWRGRLPHAIRITTDIGI